jgi:RND superfamily putative drug exporter
MFCIAFGLSMDYEVFLVSRIREFWLASRRTCPDDDSSAPRVRGDSSAPRVRGDSSAPRVRGDSSAPRVRADNSVALGIARTGRVITAAALVMSISLAALIAAHVSFMRMFGLGLTLAILADATLVRMVLVPAFMHVMGQWNWWAPKWMTAVHERLGLSDGHAAGIPESGHMHVADSRHS